MVAVLTYTPTRPVAGDTVTLALTGAAGDPDYARFEVVSVPDRSALTAGMLVDGNGAYLKTFVPDIEGKYEITPYDVRAFVGQPQHAGDPGGEARQTVVEQVARSFVNVVGYSDLRIGTLPGHDITLRFGLFQSTIVSAELVDPATDLARLAALDTTVAAKVALLVNVTVTSITSTLLARVTALRTAYEAHRVLVGGTFIHASADTTNVTDYEPPNTDDAALVCLQDLYEKITGHMLAGASGGTWHTNDDTKNTPLTPKPLTKAQGHVTASDLEERVYERHRVQVTSPAVHGASDTTNTLATPTALTDVIVAYLDFIAANTGIAITGENEGLGTAERILGTNPFVAP